MRFGEKWDPNAEPEESTGTSDYLRYFKNAETTFRIAQETDEWVDYWEHYNPNGFPFPCTRDRKTCPGCTSNNEKMKRANKRVAVNVLEGEWVNAYKLPKTVAEKLYNRAQRVGTICDRDYTIYKLQSKNADGTTKTEYDVEGGDKVPVDVAALRPKFRDIEQILTNMYDQAWGNPDAAMQTQDAAKSDQNVTSLRDRLKAQQMSTTEQMKEDRPEPPWASGETPDPKPKGEMWTEDELRDLKFEEILIVCKKEGMDVPDELVDDGKTDAVVDWLLDQ